MKKIAEFLEGRSKRFIIATAIIIVAAVGVVDYLTGPQITMSVFYLAAVALASWFAGKLSGIAISVLSVASSTGTDLSSGGVYSSPLVPVWNALILLAFYLVVVWLLESLRTSQKELEERVRQRTAALTEQMAERARLEKEILGISEQEQRRIGRDLHDSLCQHLTATAMAGQVLAEELGETSVTAAAAAAQVVKLVEDAIDLTRGLAQGLDPIRLEVEGLMESLRELAGVVSERFRINCVFECEHPFQVRDATTMTHLYRITQEAISNAIKHGKARHVTVALFRRGTDTTLVIRDDGTGLSETPSDTSGMGLRIMAHRATIIGGTFAIRRNPNGGTIVTCSFQDGT
jgi:signal transduction histidine kinase